QIAPIAPARMVAIFDQIAGRIHPSRSEVDRHHHFGIRLLRPLRKLIRADIVRFDRSPREIGAPWPILERANAVLPILTGYKIAPRITNDRHLQLLYQLDDVLPEAVFICSRMIRLVNAAVHSASQMLDKRTVNT